MRKYFDLAKQTFKEFAEDKAPRLGAALAYYTIFSIGPLLLIAISMAGIFLGRQAAEGRVSEELGKVFGPQMSQALEQMIQAASEPRSGIIATIIGVVMLLVGASGLFAQLKDALNTIWNVESKSAEGIKGFIKDRFLSMAMVLGVGFLLLVTLLLDAIISAMGSYAEQFVGGEPLMHAIQLTVSLVVTTVLFAAIFRILPDLEIAWKDVRLGAFITAILFVLGKFALGLYLGKAAVGSSYGAAGSLVVLLVWVYWSAQILFLGAEFTQVYARRYGSLEGDTSKQEARAKGTRVEDRPKSGDSREPVHTAVPMPAYAKAKRGGALVKLAAGGIAGLFLGALVGGISAFVMLLKGVKKLILPLK